MKLSVFRQTSKQRPDGTIVYKGEDARPFVDDQLFFVADGLGGAAAIRHQNINPDLFDRNKIMDTLFQGVYEEYDDDRFVEYVTESFFELFAVKDCYTDNINNIKKSGYFASRIVTAILLHEMIYNKKLNPLKLFEMYDSLETAEKQDSFLQKLGDFFAIKIRDDLRKIAKNANLYYESSYSGLALLGSTLCATIYCEKDDEVEAFYLTAGDSRPYVWTEAEGLCQILEDQEGKDGGMTNYIKANDNASFDVRCNYMSFKKPCVLFNASDGCFDSGYFLSQMAFEKLILEKATAASDTTSMGEGIYEAFLTYGKHDDSSTIAMKFFGYESFSTFQNSAANRLALLREEYLSKLPDVLEHDYISEYAEYAAKLPSRLPESETKLIAYTDESDPCRLDERIDEAKRQISRASEGIVDIIAKNYISFSSLPDHRENMNGMSDNTEIQDFVTLFEEYSSELEETTKRLKHIIGRIYELEIPTDFSDYAKFTTSVVEECNRSMQSLIDFFYSVKRKKQGPIRRLTRLRKDYIAENRKLAKANQEIIGRKYEMILLGGIDIEAVRNKILRDDFEKLQQKLSTIQEAEKLISSLRKEDKTIVDELKTQIDELKVKAELQSKLFQQYDVLYGHYLGGIHE